MNKLLNSIKNKSYHAKMFLLFSSFTIIIVIILSFSLITYYNKNFKKEIYTSNERLLTQVQIYCDNNLIQKIYLLFNDKFLMQKNSEFISDFFNYSFNNNTNNLYKLFQNIQHSINIDNNYDSICLYRKTPDIIISSKLGVNFNVTSKDNPYKNLFPMDLINKTLASKKLPVWVTPYENKSYSDKTSLISFAQPIPIFAEPQNRIGCIIININQENLFHNIKNIYTKDMGDILIIDHKGRVFANTHGTTLINTIYSYPNIDKNTIKTILNQDTGFIISNTNQHSVGITWKKSNINDWKYISIVPVNILNDSINVTKKLALIIILFGILINLIGINLISIKLYTPIKKLIKSAKNNLHVSETNGNEILFIDSVITKLSCKVTEMEHVLDNNKKLIQYKLCNDIIHGKIKDTSSVNEQLKLIHKNFIFKNFFCCS